MASDVTVVDCDNNSGGYRYITPIHRHGENVIFRDCDFVGGRAEVLKKAPSMDEAKALGCYWKLITELPELLKGNYWHTTPNGDHAPLRVEIQHRPDINETYVLVRVPPKSNEGDFYLAEPYKGFPSEELVTKLRLIR